MTDNKLDFWISKNYNVLFKGKHGVGKTARILEAFKRNNLRFKYFSTSTLDPWVDFVGVPKEVKDANGNAYLDLVRPKCFADDDVEAIFLDEYNRSQPKVRNATMELLQFKSINGRKFNNLKIIWAAVNPDKEEGDESATYDVDVIDPAQMDRFEIQVDVPYKPDYGFFCKKYSADIAKVAIDWWHELNEEQKNTVSPRRLDYAMRMYMDGGDLRDILPKQVNTSKLVTELKNGSFRERMLEILKAKDTTKAQEFISNKTNFENTIKYIETDGSALAFYLPYMSEENQVKLIGESKTAQTIVFNAFDAFNKAINAAAVSSKKVGKLLQEYIKSHPIVMNAQNFQSLTFGKVQFKANTPLSRINTTDTVVSLAPRATTAIKNSAERYALYRDLMTVVRENHGYSHNLQGTRPLSVMECEFLLSFLHTVIDCARVLNPLSDIDNFYGVVNRAYAVHGKRLSFDTLSTKVKAFITENSAKYL